MVVAWPHVAAVLVKLCGTHLAAPTSVRHGADSRGAKQGLGGAVTHCWAARSHLEGGVKGKENREVDHKKEVPCVVQTTSEISNAASRQKSFNRQI